MERVKVLKEVRYGVNLGSYIRKFPDEKIKNFCSNPVIRIHKESILILNQREELGYESILSMYNKTDKKVVHRTIFIEDKTLKGERWDKYECVIGVEDYSISPYFNKFNFVYITIDDKLFVELDNYADEKLGIKGGK